LKPFPAASPGRIETLGRASLGGREETGKKRLTRCPEVFIKAQAREHAQCSQKGSGAHTPDGSGARAGTMPPEGQGLTLTRVQPLARSGHK